jgi:hypothetical protein
VNVSQLKLRSEKFDDDDNNNIKALRKNHTGHCTLASGSANVKVRNIEHAK